MYLFIFSGTHSVMKAFAIYEITFLLIVFFFFFVSLTLWFMCGSGTVSFTIVDKQVFCYLLIISLCFVSFLALMTATLVHHSSLLMCSYIRRFLLLGQIQLLEGLLSCMKILMILARVISKLSTYVTLINVY